MVEQREKWNQCRGAQISLLNVPIFESDDQQVLKRQAEQKYKIAGKRADLKTVI